MRGGGSEGRAAADGAGGPRGGGLRASQPLAGQGQAGAAGEEAGQKARKEECAETEKEKRIANQQVANAPINLEYSDLKYLYNSIYMK